MSVTPPQHGSELAPRDVPVGGTPEETRGEESPTGLAVGALRFGIDTPAGAEEPFARGVGAAGSPPPLPKPPGMSKPPGKALPSTPARTMSATSPAPKGDFVAGDEMKNQEEIIKRMAEKIASLEQTNAMLIAELKEKASGVSPPPRGGSRLPRCALQQLLLRPLHQEQCLRHIFQELLLQQRQYQRRRHWMMVG